MGEDRSTISRLKTMDKNSSGHVFRSIRRIIKYGIIGFGRNIWLSLTSTIVMTLTLVLLFVTIVASLVLSSTADAMREKIDITVYFKPGTTETSLASMASTMKKDENVKNVEYSTTDEEYKKFLDEYGDDAVLMETLSDDAMKEIMAKSMQATMRIKVYDAGDLSSIKEIVENNKAFQDNLDAAKEPTYDTKDTAIETITNWSNIARIGGLALSGLFLFISVLVIFNTIRMAIYSRSEEIYMEKLVGADNHFIRGPFLVEAAMSGIIAGVLSAIVSIIAINTIAPGLKNYDIDVTSATELINGSSVIIVVLAFIGTGILIALISSRLAVRKYLKKI